MQFSQFSTGGFVCHKIILAGYTGRASAWFDSTGNLLDAESFNRLNRPRQVRKDSPYWQSLQSVGKRHATTGGANANYT